MILNKNIWAVVTFIVLQLLLSFQVEGQVEFEDEGPLSDSLLSIQPLANPEPDTLVLTYFFLDKPEVYHEYYDSILANQYIQYNPLYEKNIPYINLGNLGSAAIPMHRMIEKKSGFDIGYHQFDVYKKSIDEFRWNKTNVPFADLFFAAGKSSPEFRVKSRFAKNFPGGWSLNIDYERIMDEGYYQNQSTKQSGLAIGLWQESKNKRSNIFLTYLNNTNQENNNGGITNPLDVYLDNYQIRTYVPINLSGSRSRLQQNQFQAFHRYSLTEKIDTFGNIRPFSIELSNSIAYEAGFTKFYDEDTDSEADLNYYGLLMTDEIGLRSYVGYNKFSLNPGFRSSFKNNMLLNAGLSYDIWNLDVEDNQKHYINDIKVHGDLYLSPFKNAILDLEAAYHIGNNLGDMLLGGEISYKYKKYIDINGGMKLQRSNPSLIQNRLIVTGKEVYNNDFSLSTDYSTYAGIGIPALGFSASVRFQTLTNLLYFDKNELWMQSDQQVNNLRLQVSENIAFKGFHWDNSVHMFLSDADFLDLPLFYIDSKFYFKRYILKNAMLLNTGFEFFLTEGSYVPGYQVLTGSFYAQNEFETDLYPLLNFFLSFKVSSFRFYMRTDNILQLFNGEVDYQSYYYPQNDFKAFRIGVRWLFLD